MSAYLKISDVQRMGEVLVSLAARFPRSMGTERQLAPSMFAMLQIIDPDSKVEWSTEGGRIDYRTSGTNPSLVELAVAPRILGPSDQANQLSPSQNRRELEKLAEAPARSRYLLLVDLERDEHDYAPSYHNWAENHPLPNPVHIVTVMRSGAGDTFRLG